mgnify:CR=1 FL=1
MVCVYVRHPLREFHICVCVVEKGRDLIVCGRDPLLGNPAYMLVVVCVCVCGSI